MADKYDRAATKILNGIFGELYPGAPLTRGQFLATLEAWESEPWEWIEFTGLKDEEEVRTALAVAEEMLRQFPSDKEMSSAEFGKWLRSFNRKKLKSKLLR